MRKARKPGIGTARHESAHAVMYWRFGGRLGPRGVSLAPHEHGHGFCDAQWFVHPDAICDTPNPRERAVLSARMRATILFLSAGGVADMMVSRKPWPSRRARGDDRSIARFLGRLGAIGVSQLNLAAGYLAHRREARAILREPAVWGAINLVAAALLERGTLSADDIETIIAPLSLPREILP